MYNSTNSIEPERRVALAELGAVGYAQRGADALAEFGAIRRDLLQQVDIASAHAAGAARAAHADGMSMRAISRALGVSYKAVHDWVNQ